MKKEPGLRKVGLDASSPCMDPRPQTKRATPRRRGHDPGGSGGCQTPPASANLRDWKHSRQKTGRPCVGRNGTVVSLPQAEQLVVVSTRSLATIPPAEGRAARFALHALQRLGSFL